MEAKTHARQEIVKHVVPQHTTIGVHVTQHQEGPTTLGVTLNNQSRGREKGTEERETTVLRVPVLKSSQSSQTHNLSF